MGIVQQKDPTSVPFLPAMGLSVQHGPPAVPGSAGRQRHETLSSGTSKYVQQSKDRPLNGMGESEGYSTDHRQGKRKRGKKETVSLFEACPEVDVINPSSHTATLVGSAEG